MTTSVRPYNLDKTLHPVCTTKSKNDSYPSDLQASKLIAYAMRAAMGANPAYRSELTAARLELRRALGLATPVN
jgi:acid phosphatase (class A)